MTLRNRVIEYLDDRTVIDLATAGPAGLWIAAVMYVHDDLSLYFTSVSSTRHGVNIESTHHVAGAITDECRTWMEMRGLQFDGTVERVDDPAELRRVVASYLAKYPFACGLWNGEQDPEVIARDVGVHTFYKITPGKLLFTDNQHAPSGREELALG
ncbi:MAG TPA: pyridoxamine 5'-phosphate oxidase family protein [Kofleriaceae bacterium]|nr:pyridoxamine 5'-phosphate oxidase family protein [Kofleriaceae bacterium]